MACLTRGFIIDVLSISSLAILGTLLRQGMAEILKNGLISPMFPDIGGNFLGCLIMGFAVKSKNRIIEWFSPSIHLGITTGFCGKGKS